MNLNDCHNFGDFRKLAKKKLPSPIFHYIDGAADDEITYARNTIAFDDVDYERIWSLRIICFQFYTFKFFSTIFDYKSSIY